MNKGLVTVFGGSGFIGRHVIQRLAEQGWLVRVAVRDPEAALYLKPLGSVGQITPLQTNIRDEGSVRRAISGADAVINLVGILYEKGRQTFEAVHRDGAMRIAKAAAAEGIVNFVHMSALGAAPDSISAYARSKAAGEEAVRAALPDAVVIRPSVVFGPQDDFFNRFAALARVSPFLPLIGGGETKFQPVYVGDVAEAIVRTLTEKENHGKIFELGGPEIYTFRELMQLVLRETNRKRCLVKIPFWAAMIKATFLELLPVPPLTRDQVKLLKKDNILSGQRPGLEDLGITATAPEIILPTYLDIYRKGGHYAKVRPV